MNFSVVAGTTASFRALLTPPNGSMVGIPQWLCSDPGVVLAPSADGSTCDAPVPLGQTSNFDVTIKATSTDPSVGQNGVVSTTHTISVTQPPPPALTGIDFDQTAG